MDCAHTVPEAFDSWMPQMNVVRVRVNDARLSHYVTLLVHELATCLSTASRSEWKPCLVHLSHNHLSTYLNH